MKLWYLSYRNLISKPFNLVLSLVLLVLSVSLVTFVLQLSNQVKGQLNKNISPFDMVIGAKGSPLQIILSSVLHIDAPTGNIKIKEVKQLQKNPLVKQVIPLSYGDNYKGIRILGTTTDYLDSYGVTLEKGRLFDEPFEVVLGSKISKKLQLKIGDKFAGSHGLLKSSIEIHENDKYEVKGVLKSTGTVVDNLIISDIESVWKAHNYDSYHHKKDYKDKKSSSFHGVDEEVNEKDHAHEQHADDHMHKEKEKSAYYHNISEGKRRKVDLSSYKDDLEITSLLVKFRSPIGLIQMPRYINESTNLQSAIPGYEVQRLTSIFGSGITIINGIAFAILIVSGLSIFVSLLKTINERKNELALLRIYGFRRVQLLYVALLEGMFLSVLGYITGWLLGRMGVWITSKCIERSYDYGLQLNPPEAYEFFLFGIVILIALIACLLASLSIFKLNLVKTLSNE
ncbi:ABC transporter permease [Tenacibaculum sp. C7A-26P2]|uniref:ABC transporter permease n=1 Tax=Tenacibaculum sp. C7A-26P2 TaxID=3447504 RepID=UPI003F86A10C